MKYSFVIPIYNSEKYLCQCIDSILFQTYKNYEIILVDDGSKDGSGAICDDYAERYDFINVIHKENGGQSSARNAGIRAAVGEYVLFLDSDDFISDNTFLEDLDRIGDKDIIIYRYSKYFSDDKVMPINVSYALLSSEKNKFLRETVEMDGFFCSCWSKAVRRSILVDNNIVFDESLICEDVDWYYNVVMKAETFSALDRSIVMYRQREGSVTSVVKDRTIEGLLFTIDKWYEIFSGCENAYFAETMLSSLAKIYCNLLVSFAVGGKDFKKYKKQVYSLKSLLKHNKNARVKKISFIAGIVGIGATVSFFRLIGKRRK